eukprot:Opistho-2@608
MADGKRLEELKNKGKTAFASGDYVTAVQLFDEIISLDCNNYIVWSNRSAAHASLGHYDRALEDAERVVVLKPDWAKGYSRKACALSFQGRFAEAIAAYGRGLAIEPDNAAMRSGMQEAQAKLDTAAKASARDDREVNPFDEEFSAPDVHELPPPLPLASSRHDTSAAPAPLKRAPDSPLPPRESQPQPSPSLARAASTNSASFSSGLASASASANPPPHHSSQPPPLSSPSHTQQQARQPAPFMPRSDSDDCLGDARDRKAEDIRSLRMDIDSLLAERKALLDELNRRAQPPTPKQTIDAFIRGETSPRMEHHRSLKDKQALLDGAIAANDGNAVMAVILFMKKTLRPAVFLAQIGQRQLAIQMYARYLKARYEWDELGALWRFTKRPVDEGLLLYRRSFYKRTDGAMSDALGDAVRYCAKVDALKWEHSQMFDNASLLERQIKMEIHDGDLEASGTDAFFKKHPRKLRLPQTPLSITLSYASFYHYSAPEDRLSSPVNIRKTFKVSDNFFTHIAIRARSKLRDWDSVEALLTQKGTLFRSTRIKSCIGFEPVVDVLFKHDAPPEVLSKYLSLMSEEELDRKFGTAIRVGCPLVAIEALVETRDREKLVWFRGYVQSNYSNYQGSKIIAVIEDALKNPVNKWKN